MVGAGSNFHLFPFMTDQGLPPTMAVLVITVLSVCAALGGVLFGFLAERICVKKLMGGVLISIGIIFFLVFWAVKEPVWMFIFAVVYGTIRGGVLPLIFLLWTEFYGRKSSGTVLGIAGPFRLAANAAGPVSAAICFDFFDNYWLPFSVFSFLLLMAGFLCLIVKPPVSKSV
jgi:MFS family permease